MKITTEKTKNVEYKIPDINVYATFKNAIKSVPYFLGYRKIWITV